MLLTTAVSPAPSHAGHDHVGVAVVRCMVQCAGSCPSAPAWVARGTSATTAHAEAVPCSNAGTCDYATGTCLCMPGFTGAACQRSTCSDVTLSHHDAHHHTMTFPIAHAEGVQLPTAVSVVLFAPATLQTSVPTTAADMASACRCGSCLCSLELVSLALRTT